MPHLTGHKRFGHAASCCALLLCLSAWAPCRAEQQISDASTQNVPASVLPPVIVTGEKSERTTQTTGTSVKVFDEESITRLANATRVNDLLDKTANIVSVGNADDLPTVRGIDGSRPGRGRVAFFAGLRPRLNVTLDGRSLTYNELAFGPQSLWDIERTEIYLGPQSYISGRNAIAGAVILESEDPTFNWQNKAKVAAGEQSYSQLAAVISGPLTDELALRLSADRQRHKSATDLESYAEAGDPRWIVTSTYRGKLLYLPDALSQLLSSLALTRIETRAPQNENYAPDTSTGSKFSVARPVFETASTTGRWDLEWQFDNGSELENSLLYSEFSIDRLTDPSNPEANIDGHEFQVEPLFHFGTSDEPFYGQAGLRYFQAEQDEFVDIYGGSNFTDKTRTASAYAEGNFTLRPEIRLILGARYEYEHRWRSGGDAANTVSIDFDETYRTLLPKLDLAWLYAQDQTLGIKISRGYRASGAGITTAAPVTSYAFDEEYVWNYELYCRHLLFDARLELSTNIFYNRYRDMQLPYYLTAKSTTIINADDVQTYGAEISGRWLAGEDLELSASFGLLETEILKFSMNDYEGNELPRSPGYTGHLGGIYHWGKLDISADVSYFADYYSYYDNDGAGKIDSFWLADMQIAYNFTRTRLALFASNLFDDDSTILISNNDTDAPLQQQPRMIGASLTVSF